MFRGLACGKGSDIQIPNGTEDVQGGTRCDNVYSNVHDEKALLPARNLEGTGVIIL